MDVIDEVKQFVIKMPCNPRNPGCAARNYWWKGYVLGVLTGVLIMVAHVLLIFR